MSGKKLGLVLGSFVALLHLVWEVFIALGWAQPLVNFVYGLHSLNSPFVVGPFDAMKAIELVVFSFIMGVIIGHVFAFVWNKFHK